MFKRRCINGTRKNKAGECIKIQQSQAVKSTRCQKGFRKNKDGICTEKKLQIKSTRCQKRIPQKQGRYLYCSSCIQTLKITINAYNYQTTNSFCCYKFSKYH